MTSFSEFLGKGKLQKSSLGFGGSQCRRFTIYPVQKFPGCVDICSLYFSSHCELRVRFRFSWMNELRDIAPSGVSDADATRRWRRSGIAMVDLPAEGSTPTPPPSRPPSLDPPREVATRLGIDRGPKKRHHRSFNRSIKRVALYPVSWRRPSTRRAAGAVRSPIGKGSSVTSGTAGGRGATGEDKTKTECQPSLTKTCLCKRTTVSWCQTP